MMHSNTLRARKRLAIAFAAVLATAAATVPAVALAGKPVVQTSTGVLCGIPGTWANTTIVDSFRQQANGTWIGHFHGSSTFTSSTTQKWIQFVSTGTDRASSTYVDNHDGTYSIVTAHSGTGIVIKTAHGALAPNYGAGHQIFEDVFVMPAGGLAAANPEVDQPVTTNVTWLGNRDRPGGGDFCADVVVPALS